MSTATDWIKNLFRGPQTPQEAQARDAAIGNHHVSHHWGNPAKGVTKPQTGYLPPNKKPLGF